MNHCRVVDAMNKRHVVPVVAKQYKAAFAYCIVSLKSRTKTRQKILQRKFFFQHKNTEPVRSAGLAPPPRGLVKKGGGGGGLRARVFFGGEKKREKCREAARGKLQATPRVCGGDTGNCRGRVRGRAKSGTGRPEEAPGANTRAFWRGKIGISVEVQWGSRRYSCGEGTKRRKGVWERPPELPWLE